MALEGLRESLKERWTEALAKIQETSLYNTFREKFEAQTPTVQKAIALAGLGLLVFGLFYFPYGYLASSSEHMAVFEENRGLIQGLLRASRSAKEAPPLPPPMDSANLRGSIERILHDKMLVPEQIGEMNVIPGTPSSLAPKVVLQSGIAAQIKQINLNQIIDLANTFQNMGPGTKVIGIDIVQTTGQSHYYDMNVRVVNFGLPMLTPDAGDERGAGGKRTPKGASGKGATDKGVDEGEQ